VAAQPYPLPPLQPLQPLPLLHPQQRARLQRWSLALLPPPLPQCNIV
jgi:hypothetical protein